MNLQQVKVGVLLLLCVGACAPSQNQQQLVSKPIAALEKLDLNRKYNRPYVEPLDYLFYGQLYELPQNAEKKIRVFISDKGFSSSTELIVIFSTMVKGNGETVYSVLAQTESDTQYYQGGVYDTVVRNYYSHIDADDFLAIAAQYQNLAMLPPPAHDGFCDHCIRLRIDSASFSNAGPRDTYEYNSDFKEDSKFVIQVLHVLSSHVPASEAIAKQLEQSFNQIELDELESKN